VAGRELPPDPADRLKVTPREHEVLIALSRGLDATRIAGALGISLHTTRDHIRSVMGKLGVRTQLDAVVTAERLGLVDISGTF
jgi:DNA-binding NarL/FixJ family response regulator